MQDRPNKDGSRDTPGPQQHARREHEPEGHQEAGCDRQGPGSDPRAHPSEANRVGEIETIKRFLAKTFQSEILDGASPALNPQSGQPDETAEILQDVEDPANQAQIRGRQSVINRIRQELDKRKVEIRQNIDERYHGPQGEARSQAVAQRLAWIPLHLIQDDKNFENLRLKAAEEDLAELSESMKYEGLKIPITVIPVPGDDPGFFVRAGFRRLEIARRLRWKGIAAIVLPENTPTIEEYWTNIIENSARSRLSTYEIACAARTMRSKFKTRVSEFATRAGYSETYVGNLLRCLDNLPNEVIDEWKDKAPIPVDLYIAWSKMTKDEAVKMMLSYVGRHPQVVKEWLPSPSTREKAYPIRMASARGLARMQRVRFAIEVARTIDEKTREICLKIVDYCAGAREDVPQIFDPKTKLRPYKSRRREDLVMPIPGEDLREPDSINEDPGTTVTKEKK